MLTRPVREAPTSDDEHRWRQVPAFDCRGEIEFEWLTRRPIIALRGPSAQAANDPPPVHSTQKDC
jgi:hypothetical protein